MKRIELLEINQEHSKHLTETTKDQQQKEQQRLKLFRLRQEDIHSKSKREQTLKNQVRH
jgi:hypothetical protein